MTIIEMTHDLCYSGIYGNGYERIYAPTKTLFIVAVVAFLCGLVLSYKGFESAGGKGPILVCHGIASFCIALVSIAWLVAGDHICNTESAVVSSCSDASAPCYRRAEDIMIVTVVIAPFELRNIQRQI